MSIITTGLKLELIGADGMARGLGRVQSKYEGLTGTMRTFGREMESAGRGFMKAGAGLVALAAAPVGAAASMEAAFQPVKSLGEEAEGIVESATDSFLRFQARTGAGAQTYADTLYNVVSAGVAAADAVAVTEDALTGATATKGDAATFAALLGTAMNNLADDTRAAGDESQRFTDIITATQQRYQIESLAPLADGFNYASAAAKSARLPVDQLFASLGMLNTAGVAGSRAGTGLTAMMGKLNTASKALGFTYVTTADGGLDLVGTLGSLADRLGDVDSLTPDVQDKLRAAFGEQGYAALVPLLQNVEGLTEGVDALGDSSGVAMRAAAKMTDSLTGKLKILKGGFTSLFQASGSGLLDPLKGALDLGIGMVSRLAEVAIENKAVFGGIVAAVGGLGTALVGVGGSLWVTGALADNLGRGMELAAGFGKRLGRLRLAALVSPWGIALAGVAGAVYLVSRNWDALSLKAKGFANGFLDGLGPVADALAPLSDLARDAWAGVKGMFGGPEVAAGVGTIGRFVDAGRALGSAVGPAVETVTAKLRAFWAATEPIRDVLGGLARQALDFGQALLGGFASGMVDSATKSGGLFDSLRDLGDSLLRLWDAVSPAVSAFGDFLGASSEGEGGARSLGAFLGGGLVDNLTRAANAVGWVADKVAGFVEWARRAHDAAVGFKDSLLSAWGSIRSFVADFSLVEAGKNLIRGFIRGIGSMASGLVGKVAQVFAPIRGMVPGSPVKRGPLVAFNTAGEGLMKLMASTVTPAPLTGALSSAFGAVRTPALAATLALGTAGTGPPALAATLAASTAGGAVPAGVGGGGGAGGGLAPVYSPTVNVTFTGTASVADVREGVGQALALDQREFERMLARAQDTRTRL
ncbi:phage tail tape measure protein [Rubrivirga sp. IMCC45206]|uniref:phage tail tape measure protein n=1 Tax=Rubrivirga sp. IMCC45206 TaxID=3391614 RepID=UPI00398FFDF6